MKATIACEREQSLQTMWFAYRSSSFVAQNNDKIRTSVVQALLNARYYDSQRGQFLSEDPVFIGNPTDQDISNPQSLNSYSYANGNPITGKDPNGKAGVAALIPAMYGLGEFGAGATIELWGPPVAIGVIAAGTVILVSNGWRDVAQGAKNYNNNRGGNYRYIPFSEQGRQVQLPGSPDPLNPWDGWQPGSPKDWKTWVGTGIGIIGAATDIYQQAQDLPSNNPSNANTKGGACYYKNSNGSNATTPQYSNGPQGLSAGSSWFSAQVSSIQAKINQIQTKINAIVQSRAKPN